MRRPGKARHTAHLSRGKRVAFALAALAIGVILALTLAEIAVRILAPQPMAGVMFTEHPRFGFWMRPNLRDKSFQSESGVDPYRVSTNSRGFRGKREVAMPKPEGMRRVLVMGDSFTFGVGVGDEATWPTRLEDMLNAQDRPGAERWEVVNASCAGWGTENQLAFWREWGDALEPDVVVVAFYRNDLWDNLRHLVFQMRDGRLVHAPRRPFSLAKRITRLVPFYRFLAEHSHLVNLLRRAIVARTVGQGAVRPSDDAEAPALAADDRPTSAAASPASERVPSNVDAQLLAEQRATYVPLMEALIGDIGRSGARLVLAVLPGEDDCVSMPIAYYAMAEDLALRWQGEGRLLAALPRKALVQERRQGAQLEDLYLPGDGHFTPRAHEIVAREMLEAVRRAAGSGRAGDSL